MTFKPAMPKSSSGRAMGIVVSNPEAEEVEMLLAKMKADPVCRQMALAAISKYYFKSNNIITASNMGVKPTALKSIINELHKSLYVSLKINKGLPLAYG